MRRTIVLGGTGFLGRALVKRLEAEGRAAHAFSSASLDLRQAASLRALDDLAGPETDLVLLSGLTPDRGGATREGFAANVALATHVADWVATHPLRSCTFASSDVVYDVRESEAITEETPIARLEERAPRTNLYAAAKIASERVLASGADEAGVPFLVVRPAAIFGPGDTHGQYGPNLFAREARRQKRIVLFGDGEELRDHIFIDDAIDALVALIDARHAGVVNLISGVTRSFAEVAEAIRALEPDVAIEHALRRTPVVHKRFGPGALARALPELRPRPFADALRATLGAVG